MNAFIPPRDNWEQPHRAHDVITTLGRAHNAIGSAIVPDTLRPSRQVQQWMLDLFKAIQFLPTYLDGLLTMDVERLLVDAAKAIDALNEAVARNRDTIAGRFAKWLHFRRHPEEYHVVRMRPTPSGKGVGMVIPEVLPPNTVHHIFDRKGDLHTRH